MRTYLETNSIKLDTNSRLLNYAPKNTRNMMRPQRHNVGCVRPRRRCRTMMYSESTTVIMATVGMLITLFSSASNGFCLPNAWNARIVNSGKRGARGALFMAYRYQQNDLSSSPKVWSYNWQNRVVCSASTIVASIFIMSYGSVATSAIPPASSTDAASTTSTEIRGIKLTPMNSLTFNYRGGDFSGLDGSTLLLKDQPTISYQEFLEKLSNDEILCVEFLAPNGDEAYVTLKAKGGDKATSSPLRIGDGYPIERNDGWSSPAFTIRSLKDRGVPYKFILPALEKYK